MTAERIAYFEKVLSKPQPDPHGAWLRELFEAVKSRSIFVPDHDQLAKRRDKSPASKSLHVTPKAEIESLSDAES